MVWNEEGESGTIDLIFSAMTTISVHEVYEIRQSPATEWTS